MMTSKIHLERSIAIKARGCLSVGNPTVLRNELRNRKIIANYLNQHYQSIVKTSLWFLSRLEIFWVQTHLFHNDLT